MATLKDISRELGLSVTQVSRALNGHSDVSVETRQRVERAAKKLNYSPNISARKLVSGRSGMVGLVYWKYEGIEADRNFIETVTGLSAEFSRRRMQFVLHIMPPEDDPTEVYGRLINGGSLDGFILSEPLIGDTRIDFLRGAGVPFVVHGRTERRPPYPYFDIDNRGVGYGLTRYLLDHGHRRIALINGEEERTYAVGRLRGYAEALAEAGLDLDTALVSHGRMTESLGLISTIRMFDDPGRRPTAIVASNMLIAKGIYDALRAMGLSVPGDVSVVAHDDDLSAYQAESFVPAITVTRAPLRDSWAPLAEFLTGAIDGRPLAELQRIDMPAFHERESVRHLRK